MQKNSKNTRISKFIFNKFIILYLNSLVFFVNFYFFKKKKNILFLSNLKIKNVDKLNILLTIKSFQKISNYLNSNYFSFKRTFKKNYYNKNKKGKIILVDCVDFIKNNKWCIGYLKEIFKNKNYLFKLDSNNPDYVIYDVFGCEHTQPKFNNSIKIAYYSENIIPDFNEADYALSQAHLTYFDRYFKYPSFIWRLNILRNYNIEKIRKEVLNSPIRTKFCAAVISNNRSYAYFRINFIKILNNYKKVDTGGLSFNNINGKVDNKIEFLSSYKFSIAMENSEGDGYISEKIIESLLSGTIPIYYGDYMIDEFINPNVYILIKGEKDIPKKIEYIKKIDSDDILYKFILKEKVFLYNNIENIVEEEKKKFFYNIFEQRKYLSKRIDNYNYNNSLKCMI